MKTHTIVAPLAFSLLVLAACGQGGGSAPAPGSPGGPTPPPGTSEGTVDVVLDERGSPVVASFASALAVNGANEIVGFAATAPGAPFAAARWTVDGTGAPTVAPARLAPLPGNTFSAAFAVDGAGNAFGQSEKGNRRVAVRWPAGASEPVELPPLAADRNGAAFAVTADGALVVGEAENASGITRAVVWTAGAGGAYGAPLSLPVNIFSSPTMQAPFAAAHGVARVGSAIWIVGEVEDIGGTDRAVLWRSANGTSFTVTDLHEDEVRTVAHAVNANGRIVGEAELPGGAFVPSVWAQEDTGPELRRSSLAAAGAAVAIDDGDRVAGWTGAAPRAAVWTLPGGQASTPVSGPDPSRAYGINANGLVVGSQGSRGFVSRMP